MRLFDALCPRRIYQIAGSRGSRLIENLALADPQDYAPENGYIKKKMPPEIGQFYLVGTVTLSSLSTGREKSNRQLCLRLMWELAPRAFSFVGVVTGHRFLYVPSFSNGVTFSTMVYKGASTGLSSKVRLGLIILLGDRTTEET